MAVGFAAVLAVLGCLWGFAEWRERAYQRLATYRGWDHAPSASADEHNGGDNDVYPGTW